MQQLISTPISAIAQRQGSVITLDLPLPATPARAQQFVSQFCAALNLQSKTVEWGADRMQVILHNNARQFLLVMEWLCESIWLEPLSASPDELAQLWQWLQEN